MRAWMRLLSVTFKSEKQKKSVTFGNNFLKGRDDFNITVSINKYMSTLKDTATIMITNLTYYEIIQLIKGEYFSVEIKCGYVDSGEQTVFKGGVLYISNTVDSSKENVVIINCASEFVASWGQGRMNLSLNSGVNMYSALKYLCRKEGIRNANISDKFRDEVIDESYTISKTFPSFIDALGQRNKFLVTNADSSLGSIFSIADSKKANMRIYDLTDSRTIMAGSWPQINKNGVEFTTIPTINYMCGDTVKLDNSVINMGTSGTDASSLSKGYYLDKEGYYMIYQLQYRLQNRGSDFSVRVYGKARSLISNYIGGV